MSAASSTPSAQPPGQSQTNAQGGPAIPPQPQPQLPPALSIALKKNPDCCADDMDSWLTLYKAIIRSQGKRIGHLYFRIVDGSIRDSRARFEEMRAVYGSQLGEVNTDMHDTLYLSEMGGGDLQNLGCNLFDLDGKLRPQFLTTNRGTGVFGAELGRGSFALVSGLDPQSEESFVVDEAFQGRGVATWALKAVLGYMYSRWAVPFTYVCTLPEEARFFQKAGFRRVGTSHYLAYATSSTHPSRSLTIENDAAIDQQLQYAPRSNIFY
ncbi:hypothetical protein K439DRAFT_1618956 [Ramaria rubella]|nr:hypothetical protein K439DRAFT_1618956 [Ramaria rubella]